MTAKSKTGPISVDWLTLKGAMPQGSYFGPFSFIVFIMDMPLPLEVKSVKYVDDTTLSEHIKKNHASMLQETADKVLSWSEAKKMKITESKTKELFISSFLRNNHHPPTPLSL